MDRSGRTNIVNTSAAVAYVNVYVSSSGSDTTGNGSSSKPYATINKAYSQVKTGGGIIVMNNITQNVQANFNLENKKVTITSNGNNIYTVTRGSSLTNSPLLWTHNSNETILNNIIFDGNNVSSQIALIAVQEKAKLTMGSGVTLKRASNNTLGGAVWVKGSTLDISGAIMSNNVAQNGGGAIYANEDSTINFMSGSISNNQSSYCGGGIFLDYSTINLFGGTINENSSDSGGGVCGRNTSWIILNGSTISNNSAPNAGGGLYLNDKSKMWLYSGNVQNNTSSQGAGIAVGSGDLEITGGNITGNSGASYCGGGVFYSNAYATYSNSGGNISSNSPDNVCVK